MRNYLNYALCATVLLAGAAHAENASSDLTKIEAETLLLKAREKQLDVQAKIVAKQSEIASKQAETDRLAQSAVIGNPVILSIEGLGARMFATLRMENGTSVDIQPGDVLSNGMKIVSIRPNEVIIETDKNKRMRLAVASHSAPVAFDPAYPGTGLHLPPLAPPTAFKGN
jgi:type IV pilus biogenesis protein PilP